MSKLIFVQKLLHFEVRDFGRISYKKMDKRPFSSISRQTYQDLQFLLKLAEIWTRCSHHIGEQSQESFFENFENWRFYANFSRKMAWKWLFLGHFSQKIGTNNLQIATPPSFFDHFTWKFAQRYFSRLQKTWPERIFAYFAIYSASKFQK